MIAAIKNISEIETVLNTQTLLRNRQSIRYNWSAEPIQLICSIEPPVEPPVKLPVYLIEPPVIYNGIL